MGGSGSVLEERIRQSRTKSREKYIFISIQFLQVPSPTEALLYNVKQYILVSVKPFNQIAQPIFRWIFNKEVCLPRIRIMQIKEESAK